MKKHILSYYGEKRTIDNHSVLLRKGPTSITETIESTEQDGFSCDLSFVRKEATYITKSIENSDPDNFDMLIEPTKYTYTIETNDEDGFAPSFS